MDQDRARGVLNQLFYPLDGAADLSDATAARLVDNMIDGRLFSASVADFAAAVDLTLQAGSLPPQTAEASWRWTEPELLEFTGRVARALEARRPWPLPRSSKLNVSPGDTTDESGGLDRVRQAVGRGDWRTARSLISELPAGALSGEDGARLVRAAVEAGDADAVEVLALSGVDLFVPWPAGGDALSWAADHGDVETVWKILGAGGEQHTASVRAALEQAAGWLTVDPGAELRRRLSAPVGGVLERRTVWEPNRLWRTTRLELRLPDGRSAWVLTAHGVVVTELETELGIEVPLEALLARARHNGDTESHDWSSALNALTRHRPVEAAYRWAVARIADPELEIRRFAVEAVQRLSDEDSPFAAEMRAAVAPRLAVEDDGYSVANLLSVYAELHEPGPLPEVLARAGHPAADVRRRVAALLDSALPDPATVSALIALTDDAEAEVRAAALGTLSRSEMNDAGVLRAYEAHRHDTDDLARSEALAGLALNGDAGALDALFELGGTEDHGPLYWRAYEVSRRCRG